MLNMDSADESLIIAGCAGGLRSTITLPISREPFSGEVMEIRIGGLAGGHSGEDIHRGRANANKLMGAFLNTLVDFKLINISGGSKDNVIPSVKKQSFKAYLYIKYIFVLTVHKNGAIITSKKALYTRSLAL